MAGQRSTPTCHERDANVSLAAEARRAMERSAVVTAQHADATGPVYGVTTGFGSLATVPIPAPRRPFLCPQRQVDALDLASQAATPFA
jgi:histidine ammonia-lyase